MRVYVSSTFEDLRAHRDAVVAILRQLGHEVAAMEDYVAEAERPLSKVLDDVAASDVYVGIFAWRYGYVPDTGPQVEGAVPGETSITEYEYRKAVESKKPVLVFMLSERAAWPVILIDREPTASNAVRRLRVELQRDHMVAFFETPDQLAARVSAAVSTQRLRAEVQEQLVTLVAAQITAGFASQGSLADSAKMPIVNFLESERPMNAAVINISTVWWSTRLYVLAALGQHLGQLRRILVERDKEFVGLVSCATVRATLRRIHREAHRFETTILNKTQGTDVAQIATECLERWDRLFDPVPGGEQSAAHTVTAPNLRLWFGEAFLETPVQMQDLQSASGVDLLRIFDYPNDFVPIQETRSPQQNEVRLIDKRQLTSVVARRTVAEMLDRAGLPAG